MTPSAGPDPAGSGEAAAYQAARAGARYCRALLLERQDKAELNSSRRDSQFAASVAGEVLLDTEHKPLPSRSLLSPRWMCPFRVLARTAPSTYRLDIPAT